MAEKTINIGGRLHSTATGNVVAAANEVFDYTKNKTQAEINADTYSKEETYNKNQLNELITTPNVQYITVPTFNSLPTLGSANTIYRVSNWDGGAATPAVDASKYSEYAWDGSNYVLLSVKSAVDEVFDVSVFNAESGVAKAYETLTTALGGIPANRKKGGMSIKFIQTTPATYNVVKTEGVTELPTGTLLDSASSIASGTYTASQLSDFSTLPTASAVTYYVAVTEDETTTYTTWVITLAQSSDNKYVQYRYMGTSTAAAATFSNVENWQGVDNVPVHDSKNLIESGGVFPTKQAVDDASVEVDDELANGTNHSVYNNANINGLGGALTDNVTISKVTVRVGSRSNTDTPTKIYLCLRKDSKDGEVLYSGYVGYSPSDDTMRDCVFDLSSNPVSYEGLIYYQIWSDINIPKITTINPADYKYTVKSSYTTNNGSSWANAGSTYTIAYIRYVVGTKRKIEIDSDHLQNGAVSAEKLTQELSNEISSKASAASVEELSQTVGGLTDDVATNTEDIEDVQDDVDKILENYADEDVWSENAQLSSKANSSSLTGRGNSIAINKTIYKVKLYIANRSSTSPVTKAKLVLRKDSRLGDILASKTVDFSYTDTSLHEVEFILDNPVTYSGEIYCTVQCNNLPAIGVIAAADYTFTADSSYTASIDLTTDVTFTKASNNNTIMYAKYVAVINKVLSVGTSELEDECVTEAKIDSDFLTEIKNENIDLHPGVRAVLPSDIVVTTGSNLEIFYRGVVSAFNPYNYNVEVTVINRTTGLTAGQAYPRYYQLKATTNKIGTYDMTINVRDDANNIISTASSVIRVIANPSSPSSQKNILVFGASIISPGYVTNELRRRLTLSSGTLDDTANPLGLGLSNIGFIGRKTGSEITDIHQEATGGWGWNTFDSAGVPRYRFYITDGSGDDIVINETFTMNGLTFTVKEKNITGGDGNISCTFTGTLVGEIPASGTLELTSGDVNYSSYIYENANPFWNPNKAGGAGVDIKYYVDTYCNGDDIDILISSLGVNSMAGETWDKDAIIAHIKDIARAFHTYNANGKFIISSIAVPDPTGGFGYNYGANGAISNYYTIIRRFFEFSELVEDIANDDEFSSYVVHAPVMQESDGENMYPKYEMKVNNRSTTKEKVGANAYHPTSVGYNIIADAIYQSICDVLS